MNAMVPGSLTAAKALLITTSTLVAPAAEHAATFPAEAKRPRLNDAGIGGKVKAHRRIDGRQIDGGDGHSIDLSHRQARWRRPRTTGSPASQSRERVVAPLRTNRPNVIGTLLSTVKLSCPSVMSAPPLAAEAAKPVGSKSNPTENGLGGP